MLKILILKLALECHKLRNLGCPSREKTEKNNAALRNGSLYSCGTQDVLLSPKCIQQKSKRIFAFPAGKMVLMAGAFDLTSCKLIKT